MPLEEYRRRQEIACGRRVTTTHIEENCRPPPWKRGRAPPGANRPRKCSPARPRLERLGEAAACRAGGVGGRTRLRIDRGLAVGVRCWLGDFQPAIRETQVLPSHIRFVPAEGHARRSPARIDGWRGRHQPRRSSRPSAGTSQPHRNVSSTAHSATNASGKRIRAVARSLTPWRRRQIGGRSQVADRVLAWDEPHLVNVRSCSLMRVGLRRALREEPVLIGHEAPMPEGHRYAACLHQTCGAKKTPARPTTATGRIGEDNPWRSALGASRRRVGMIRWTRAAASRGRQREVEPPTDPAVLRSVETPTAPKRVEGYSSESSPSREVRAFTDGGRRCRPGQLDVLQGPYGLPDQLAMGRQRRPCGLADPDGSHPAPFVTRASPWDSHLGSAGARGRGTQRRRNRTGAVEPRRAAELDQPGNSHRQG